MKVTVERDALAEAVTAAAKAIAARPHIPVLAGVMLETGDDGLNVSGFDYEVASRSWARGTVTDPGKTLVSGRLLAEITKALPGKPVSLASVGAHLELVCGSARFTLPTMPVEDYPTLPDMPAGIGTLDAAVFAQAVAQVAVAAGRDDTLPMMTGIRVEINGGTVDLLATDRYRLALRSIPWTPADPDVTVNALVPASTLHDMVKAFGPAGGDVTLALTNSSQGEGLIGVHAGRRRVTSRLLDGANYPPVRSLFPDADKVTANAVVPVATLIEVVKRVALVAERATPVLLTFSADGLMVEAGGTEEARASEAMDIGSYEGDPLTVGFNPQYLVDGLSSLHHPTAHIQFVDPFKPAVISPASDTGEATTDHRYLIMPIRVSR